MMINGHFIFNSLYFSDPEHNLQGDSPNLVIFFFFNNAVNVIQNLIFLNFKINLIN